MNLNVLKTELQAGHPGTGAYDADSAIAAAQLNAVNHTKNRTFVSPAEMQASVVGADFVALSAVAQRAWLAILSDDVDPTNANTITQVEAIWPAGATRTNLIALQTEPGSRAEELGFGRVSAGDIERARAL